MSSVNRERNDAEELLDEESGTGLRSERMARKEALRKKKMNKCLMLSGFAIVAVQVVLSVLLAVFTKDIFIGNTEYSFNKRFFIYYVVAIAVLAVLALVFFFMQLRRVPGIVAKVISIILSVCLCIGCVYVLKTKSALQQMNNTTEVIQMNVYVLADDPAQSLEDTVGYTFGILAVTDREYSDEVLVHTKDVTGEMPATSEYLMPEFLASALFGDEVDAIVLNAAQVSMIEDHPEYSDFSEATRIVGERRIENKVDASGTVDMDDFMSDDTFTVYISGIDTYDSEILANSRSDVNILLFANKKTKQILMVSTPRDTYVYIPSYDYYDKLTHAGNNGINSSMDALRQLYDIDIDYYFKVNFKGFENIVDTLGGIRVYSEKAFRSTADSSYRGHFFSFKQGYNDLNGEQALVFARERHAFADGDFQRGRDQMAVIQAIFNKLCSPAILSGYSGLLEDVQDYFKTNMTLSEIAALVRMQLDDGAEWNIKTYMIEGEGETLKSNGRWVLKPYTSSINAAKALIESVEDGVILTDEMIDGTASD